jgi:poly [ADP-ribose] polymerase
MRNLKPLIERRMDLEKLSKREHVAEYMNILDQINKYSNEYYELIPQMNNNYEKLAPIWNEQQLDAQVCVINQLNNSQIACRILMGARMQLATINPFDYVYSSLNCKLEVLNPLEKETQYILRYIHSHQQDNLESKLKIKRIFKFERPGEQDRFDKVQLPNGGNKIKNRTLLWHGTCTENLISIMCRGLIKAPNDSKLNGHRYGKGLYFSDSFEFSSGYSSGRKETIRNLDGSKSYLNRNYMLLCEVALGQVKELRNSYETVDSLPSGYDSVKVLGRKEPDPASNVTLPSGCVIPLGKQIDSQLKPGENIYSRGINYSQYVIYNESQVCIRYIVQYYTHQ